MTQNNKNNDLELIEKLKNSTTLYMSLGSKELFHSNFLHWLSIVDWKYFITIMKDLAGVSNFWWENEDRNNIIVLRENHNYDLSIYFKYQKTTKRRNKETGLDEKKNIDYWTPVLILENKMKSIPYEDQLKKYSQSTFDEWKKFANVEKKRLLAEAKKTGEKKKDFDILEIWKEKGITSILLSLIKPDKQNISYKVTYSKITANKAYTYSWCYQSYEQLSKIMGEKIDSFSSEKDLNKKLLKDYVEFIKNLSLLSKSWIIKGSEHFMEKICPDKSNDPLVNMRINDIREKILCEEILELFREKIENNPSCSLKIKKNTKDKACELDCDYITYSASFSHGSGILEFYVRHKDKNNNQICSDIVIGIQIQAGKYEHVIVTYNCKKDIVNFLLGKDGQELSSSDKEFISKLQGFFDLKKKTASFPKVLENKAEIHPVNKYGMGFAYQYETIKKEATINEVLDAIIGELKEMVEYS